MYSTIISTNLLKLQEMGSLEYYFRGAFHKICRMDEIRGRSSQGYEGVLVRWFSKKKKKKDEEDKAPNFFLATRKLHTCLLWMGNGVPVEYFMEILLLQNKNNHQNTMHNQSTWCCWTG